MENLGILFGSNVRIKLIRHFLLNKETKFSLPDLIFRTKTSGTSIKKELNILKKASFVKETIIVEHTKSGKTKKVKGFVVNSNFPYFESLFNLILQPQTVDRDLIIKRFKKLGKVKLLIISGILTGQYDSRVDILLVGKEVEIKKLERVVREIEADVGRELSYAAFDVDDFMYRVNMYDKLIADVLDYPHERLIDLLPVSTRRTVN